MKIRVFQIPLLLALLSVASVALAHGGGEEAEPSVSTSHHSLWTNWAWEPLSVVGLALSATLYAIGLNRIWRGSGVGHGIKRWEAGCFVGGWITLFVALLSPIHPLGQLLFSAHMTQHELLMLGA